MVREIPLTQGFVALVDDEDYERVMQFKWYAHRDNGNVYARSDIRRNGKKVSLRLHRFILDAPPDVLVDHADGNGLDCTRRNIRFATVSQNNANKNTPGSSSGYRGVVLDRRRGTWTARISVNGHEFNRFGFGNPRDAARAYDVMAIEHFGQFARPNFPIGDDAP